MKHHRGARLGRFTRPNKGVIRIRRNNAEGDFGFHTDTFESARAETHAKVRRASKMPKRGPGGKFLKRGEAAYKKPPMSKEDRIKRMIAGAAKARAKKWGKQTRAGKRVKFGPYRRLSMTDPLTHRKRLSYLFKSKSGKVRRIPTKALLKYSKSKKFTQATIDALRKKAAERILSRGGVFTPNPKKRGKKMRLHRVRRASAKKFSWTSKRGRALKKAIAARRRMSKNPRRVKSKARRLKVRVYRKRTKRGTSVRVSVRSNKKRTARKTRRARVTVKRRRLKRGTRVTITARANRKHRRRSHAKRRVSPNRKHRRMHAKRRTHANRKRHMRSNRRHYARRNSFFSSFLEVLKTGAIVGAGFLVHRIAVNVINDMLLFSTDATGAQTGLLGKMGMTEINAAKTDTDKVAAMKKWGVIAMITKPILGLAVVAAGVPLAGAVLPKHRLELGGGMVASLIQQAIIAGLNLANDTNNSMHTAIQEISGYESPYALHGKMSIMPRYTPVGEYFQPMGEYFQPMSGLGAFSQAAAGFSQAAAGMGAYTQAAAGLRQATGEYFAPSDIKGIGQYEGAGEQALLPTTVPTSVDDGIRPDTDLDRILDLAESAAGMRGTGEFFSAQASNGGFSEQIVPQQSQWIPNGPLWAGTLDVTGTKETSTQAAGILATQGGNGILSA